MTLARPFLVALLMALSLTCVARADWPTAGGEGGAVVRVTTLSDAGPGSLREALRKDGPRRIVFDVGGEIWLKKPLSIQKPFVTIDGETAPGPGISLIGEKVHIRTHDVILRGVRIRIGELPGSNPSSRDGITIEPAKGGKAGNILIERCSVSWALDENIGFWGRNITNVLIRDSIIAEALRDSIHPKGSHSMGMLVGKGSSDIVIERNLFAHNVHRNPAIDAGASAIVVNNLIYDPVYAGFQIYGKQGEGPTLVSVVGNIVIAGPDTKSNLATFAHGINSGSQIYYADNEAVGVRAFVKAARAGKDGSVEIPWADAPPLWRDEIKPLPVAKVQEAVLAGAGVRPLDETDRRIIDEVRGRAGRIRDTPPDTRLQQSRPLPKNGTE